MKYLESISSKSRTAKHWVDNLIKPISLIILFVRAEREGDWPLHLYACTPMCPYFFTARHVNFARYGIYYINKMYRLDGNALQRFMKGEHVMRHKSGFWNGMWSDMFIEMTWMKYGKGNRSSVGLVGVSVKPETAKKITLSKHTFTQVKHSTGSYEKILPQFF